MQPAWKNRNSNEQYCLHIKREKLTILFQKNLPPQNIVPHLMFINMWNFIVIFYLSKYSLIGILKPKSTRRNEI